MALDYTADEVRSSLNEGFSPITFTPPMSPECRTLPLCPWLLNSDKGTGFMLVLLAGCPLNRTLGPLEFVSGSAAVAFLFPLKKLLRTGCGVDTLLLFADSVGSSREDLKSPEQPVGLFLTRSFWHRTRLRILVFSRPLMMKKEEPQRRAHPPTPGRTWYRFTPNVGAAAVKYCVRMTAVNRMVVRYWEERRR